MRGKHGPAVVLRTDYGELLQIVFTSCSHLLSLGGNKLAVGSFCSSCWSLTAMDKSKVITYKGLKWSRVIKNKLKRPFQPLSVDAVCISCFFIIVVNSAGTLVPVLVIFSQSATYHSNIHITLGGVRFMEDRTCLHRFSVNSAYANTYAEPKDTNASP